MSRALYAATEGQLWIKEFKIYQNEADCTNVYCDLYIKNTAIDGNGGTCRTSGGEYRISIETSLTPGLAGQIFNHEAGHCWFEYLSKEEYVTASGSIFYQMSTCGHSAMGAADAHRWGATKDFCRSSDHGEDPATNVGDIGPSGSEYLHLWYYLNSSGIPTTQFISTTGTNSNPDPYDYYQKDPSNLTASENLREADILFAPFININTVPD
jgi:hypothetical protein